MTGVLVVIPVRMAATRLPGKPLALLRDRPVVAWVHAAAAACPEVDRVVVATDSPEIADTVAGFGGEVVMTSSACATGTDRVAEAARLLPGHQVVVNLQGDLPFATPEMLRRLIAPFVAADPTVMATIGAPLQPGQIDDPDAVKVLLDRNGDALYFSRAPVPYVRVRMPAPVLHHLGLYAFEAEFLQHFATLPPTPLEQIEGLEQLRALEHGHRIRVSEVEHAVLEINTPSDLAAARALVEEVAP